MVKSTDGARWHGEEITLESGQLSHFVDIPVLEVIGSVSMDGSPVAGQLDLMLREKGSRVSFDVDEEGSFHGSLPHEGLWAGRFKMDEEPVLRLALDSIEVEHRSDGRPVELDIELPDTRLEGQVVDSEGPVGGAHVVVIHLDALPNSETRSDTAGEFDFAGLRPGSVQIFAIDEERQSEIQVVDLQEELVPAPLRLVLLEPLELVGQVLSANGQPLPGANVTAWLEGGSSPLRAIKQATTDVDGTFTLDGTGASSLSLFVRAPGHASHILHLPADPEKPILVVLDRDGGSLVLEQVAGQTVEEKHESLRYVFMVHEGASIPLLSFLQQLEWSLVQSLSAPQLEIPALASGDYTVRRSIPLASGSVSGTGAENSCETAFVNLNGVSTIAIPVLDAAEPPQS